MRSGNRNTTGQKTQRLVSMKIDAIQVSYNPILVNMVTSAPNKKLRRHRQQLLIASRHAASSLCLTLQGAYVCSGFPLG